MKKLLLALAVLVFPAASAIAGSNREAASKGGETLTYLAWNLGTVEENNLERQMLAAFKDAHQDVALTILEVPNNADGTAGSYGDYLNSLAAQANLPDVFMWTSVPDTAAKGWALNVSDYALNDPDFQRVMAALRENSKVNGHVYAFPSAMHLYGIAVNQTIFEELNVPPLPFSYTIDDLQDRIARTTTDKYKGIDNFAIEDWGPFVLDSKLGFGTFDGNRYNYTSTAYAHVIGIYHDVASRRQTGNGNLVEASSWLPEGVGWAWGEGYIALQYEATWSLDGFVNGDRPFKADMLPLPGEKAVLVPDFIYAGANTKQPALAYELAKWMSFGADGQKKRVEIAKAAGKNLDRMPIAPGAYPEVDSYYLQNYRRLGNFIQLYEMIQRKPENVIVEGYKVVPGYERSRFTADTGVLGTVGGVQKSMTMNELVMSIVRGDHQLADYAAEMERIANSEYQRAAASVRDK